MYDNNDARIARIEYGRFTAIRPRTAGPNARRGVHGKKIGVPITRVTTTDGATGIGFGAIPRERAENFLSTRLSTVFMESGLVNDPFQRIEYPLYDLAGIRADKPVYALAAAAVGATPPVGPLRVRVYDTSLYFDDLHLDDNSQAAALIAGQAREGFDGGHRAFKIKVGRGNRYMELQKGTARDIAIIRAVRNAVGAKCEIMIDANNGFNLNLTKEVLRATADCRLYWIEEPFHEDAEMDGDLKRWLRDQNMETRIADGEGDASPHLLHWAREGIIDVIQYDVFGYGFGAWLRLGPELDALQVGSACHHYGAFCGNYVTGHLAAAIKNFQFVEWDQATAPGLDAPGYVIEEGMLTIPEQPGFGWCLDEAAFARAIASDGYDVRE